MTTPYAGRRLGAFWLDTVFAFSAACVIFGFRYRFDIRVFDEGLALYGSFRVAEGELPYRDFWTMYAPGSYYLNAFAFHIFGPSVGIVRAVWTGAVALVVAELLILGRLLGGRTAGWLAFVLAVVQTLALNPHSGYPAIPALVMAFGALIVFGLYHAAFLAGVLTGLTAVFRLDFGVYLAAAVVAGVLLRVYATRQPLAHQLLRFVAGAGIIAGPVYGTLAFVAGIRPVVDQLLVFPLTVLPRYAHLPWPLGKPLLWMPLVVLAVAILVIVVNGGRDRQCLVDRRMWLTALLCLFALGLFNFARFRFDPPHVWPLTLSMMPLIAAAPFVGGALIQRVTVSAGVLGFLALAALVGVGDLSTGIMSTVAVNSPRASGIEIPKSASFYNHLIQAVQSETRPGEPIFSGSVRHDRIDVNDVLLYFLTDRPAPTPYHELNRGLIVTGRVQAEVIQAMETRQVRVLVLLNLDSREPNQSSMSSGVTLLDDYIRNHFGRVGRFGPYELWRRR